MSLSILKTIFGSGDVVKKGLDLIDDAWETDAEERESKTKAKIDLMQAYAPFKLAQRYLALLFGVPYVLTYVLVLVMTLAGFGDADDVRNVIAEFQMDWIMLVIVGFYFGGGLAESVGRNKLTKTAG